MKKFIYLAFILLTIQSCNTASKSKNGTEIIDIDVDSATESVDMSNLIDTVILVKLETNISCLLSRIKKMVITENEILILDDFVYIFDLNGNFKRKVGSKGKGPGELISSNDFVVDSKSGNIEIFDFNQNRLSIFSENGEYQDQLKFPFERINRFEKNDSQDYVAWKCLSNKEDPNAFLGYKIHVGNFQKGFTEYKPCYQYDDNLRLNQSFSKGGEDIYFWEMLGDTIYEINQKNEFIRKYYINFGANKIPEAIQNIPLYEKMTALKENYKVASAIDNFYSCPKFIYFNFLHNKKQYNVFIAGGIKQVGNNILYESVHFPNFSYFNGTNILASIAYPDKISNSLRSSLKDEFLISENPIISIFKLKE